MAGHNEKLMDYARDIAGVLIVAGDWVESVTNDHPTAALGRRFQVDEIYRNGQGPARLRVSHPYKRFGRTSYYAYKFKRVDGPHKKENHTMYLAFDFGNKRLEDIDASDIGRAPLIGVDTSMDRGLKDMVEDRVRRHPESTIAVFRLDQLATIYQPQVVWKDMR